MRHTLRFLYCIGIPFVIMAGWLLQAEAKNPISQPFNFANELEQLEPTPKPIISWPWGPEAWAHGKELARVTHSVGLGLKYASEDRIREALTFEPEIITFTWKPYSDMYRAPGETKKTQRKWNKDDCELITQRDYDYWNYFYSKAKAAAAIIDNKAKVIVFFDHETCHAQGPVISQKLNLFYRIAKFAFGEDTKVFFYNWNQYASGRGLALMQRASPVASSVRSDFCSFSLYFAPRSVECLNRLKFTTEKNTKPAAAWVSIGEHYADYSYYKPPKKRRSKNVLYPTQYGESWYLGRWLMGKSSNKFGDTNQVELICAWPELLDSQLENSEEHLIMFLKGCNGVYVE